MGRNVFIYTPELEEGGYPPECPFSSKRAGMTRQTIDSMGLLDGHDVGEVVPTRATREELESFHSPRYLDAIRRVESGDLDMTTLAMGLGTSDCPIFSGMYDYLSLACGASLTAARMILDGAADTAFNPSGGFHHAGPELAAGFCYMNDVVLAARLLTDAGKRVLFLDLDVHHCGGVQNAFYEKSDVMTISLHESGRTLFPGTGFEDEIGTGTGKGFTANIPLPVGTYDEAYYHAFAQVALPLAKAYNPDVIMLELGMDTLAGDPLAHLRLTNNAIVDAIRDILALDKPVLATGGGGYNVANTVRGWSLAWEILTRQDDKHDVGLMMGGVMMQNTEWAGGLRDRTLAMDRETRCSVEREINGVVSRVQDLLFEQHGISSKGCPVEGHRSRSR